MEDAVLLRGERGGCKATSSCVSRVEGMASVNVYEELNRSLSNVRVSINVSCHNSIDACDMHLEILGTVDDMLSVAIRQNVLYSSSRLSQMSST